MPFITSINVVIEKISSLTYPDFFFIRTASLVTINLAAADRESIQSATEALQDVGNDQLKLFVQQLLQGNEGVIRRFAKGAYNHPISWWVGVFHLQMQKGMWGARYQASANMRGSILTQVLRPVRSELKRASGDEDTLLLSRAVKYNLKYKKADIAGRFTGGQYTKKSKYCGAFRKHTIIRQRKACTYH